MELIDLLLQALSQGIKIEITIKLQEQPQRAPEVRIPVRCEVCQWVNSYASQDQAKKGLNAKRQHCEHPDCPKHSPAQALIPQWMHEQMQGNAEEK
jgi:hypothetical protein